MAKKILPLVVAISMMLVLVAPASAVDDFTVLYVGTGWTTFDFNATGVANNISDSNDSANYAVTKIIGYNLSDPSWSTPSQVYLDYANNTLNSSYSGDESFNNFDVVFIEMVNMYNNPFNDAFYAANDNGTGTTFVAVMTGPNNSTCFMPLCFSIRDTRNLSALSTYANTAFISAFFNIFDVIYNDPARWNATAQECEDMIDVLYTYKLN